MLKYSGEIQACEYLGFAATLMGACVLRGFEKLLDWDSLLYFSASSGILSRINYSKGARRGGDTAKIAIPIFKNKNTLSDGQTRRIQV